MYMNGMFNMDVANENVEYAVFDDLIGGFEFFRNYKGWLGAQEEFTLNDKWRHKRKFMWGKPSIMLMNDDPRISPHVDLEWLEGNCDIVYVGDCFVHFPTEWPDSDQEN